MTELSSKIPLLRAVFADADALDFPLKRPELLPVSDLAWVGDAVFELLLRTAILTAFQGQAGKLNAICTHYVSARGQAEIFQKITQEGLLQKLDQTALQVLHRGHNYKAHSTAKNVDVSIYRKATAVEALVGFLYLAGKAEILRELLQMAMIKLVKE